MGRQGFSLRPYNRPFPRPERGACTAPVDCTIFLAWAQNERMGPASAKFAELLRTEAGHDFRAE